MNLHGAVKVIDQAAAKSTLGTIDAHIRRRLRALVLRQKKRKRYIYYFFRKQRVKATMALNAVYGGNRSLWALSISAAAHKAMGSRWFDDQGLHRLERLWKKKQPGPAIAPWQHLLPSG